ncbi:TIGR04222 domain-containing membrane protein [Actinomadura violacea]|uniref:TIGR04222 domain-containing membrane protein n=1 Tax=Actinomadura violacea TaxID=2819934 RepID=A0ABS3RYK5_9ACTN|nr:TIGR04222 domain-containing membrane protein [Actinomadura violacea]MBO2461840.1 TIGR04222 domain-containing membrane protein [Actinomadura violacea]
MRLIRDDDAHLTGAPSVDETLWLLTLHFLIGLVLAAVVWRRRSALVRGTPPTRDPHPYEIAYLQGGGRHAIAASLAALRTDGAVDAHGDGRLTAARPPSDAPRTADHPLDGAVFTAIAEERAGTLAELTADTGVSSALDGLRDGLIEQGLLIRLGFRPGLWANRWLLRGWVLAGFVYFFMIDDAYDDFPKALIVFAPLAVLSWAAIRLAAGHGPTKEGERAVAQVRSSSPHLDPAQGASYDGLAGPAVVMGVALFGTAALMAFDEMFAQTVGLGRYLQLTGVAASSGGYTGSACSSSAIVCSSASCGGGGSGGGHHHGCGSGGGHHGCGGGGGCGSSCGGGSSCGSSCGGGS